MRQEIYEVSVDGKTWMKQEVVISGVERIFSHRDYELPHKRTRVVEGDPRLLQRQIAALRRTSSERWEPIVQGKRPCGECALCDEFECATSRSSNVCPLIEDENDCSDEDSTYVKWIRSGVGGGEFAQAMLDALRKSLRKRERLLAELLGPKVGGEEREVEMNAKRMSARGRDECEADEREAQDVGDASAAADGEHRREVDEAGGGPNQHA
jgi:hypothetical protein